MAEPTISITYDDLRREIGRFLGWGRDPALWAPESVTDCEDILRSMLRMVLTPAAVGGRSHRWSFLYPLTTLTLSAAYSTGTVAIAAGVVTLTGGTWPTWAADGELTVNGVTYTVKTRDSNTQLTLDDLSVTIAGPKAHTLTRPTYTLPDDFGALLGPLTYRPGTSFRYRPIEQVSEHQIRTFRQGAEYTGIPRWCAVRPKRHDPTTGQRFELLIWPVADSAYEVAYRYAVHADALTSTNKYPPGGADHSELYLAAALHAAEQRFRAPGEWQWEQKFLERLAASISKDEQNAAPDFLGYNPDQSDRYFDPYRRPGDFDNNLCTFEGQVYS